MYPLILGLSIMQLSPQLGTCPLCQGCAVLISCWPELTAMELHYGQNRFKILVYIPEVMYFQRHLSGYLAPLLDSAQYTPLVCSALVDR